MVRGMLEVATDLAEAPGHRSRPQQRVARGREAGRRQVELAGGQALETGERRFLQRLARAAVERMVDGERRPGPAAAYRQVLLVHLAGHQRAAQRGGGVAVE